MDFKVIVDQKRKGGQQRKRKSLPGKEENSRKKKRWGKGFKKEKNCFHRDSLIKSAVSPPIDLVRTPEWRESPQNSGRKEESQEGEAAVVRGSAVSGGSLGETVRRDLTHRRPRGVQKAITLHVSRERKKGEKNFSLKGGMPLI